MLARSVMTVVFVPGEVISQGSSEQSGLTAGEKPVFLWEYGLPSHKVP